MTAKEMFETLGYEQKYNYITNKDKTMSTCVGLSYKKNYDTIVFDLIDERIYSEHCEALDIDMPLFEAIQQQLKELGWIKC